MLDNTFVCFGNASLHTTPDAPGHMIQKSFGMVGVYSLGGALTKSGYEDLLQNTAAALLAEAVKLGGNAVVAVKLQPILNTFSMTGTAVSIA